MQEAEQTGKDLNQVEQNKIMLELLNELSGRTGITGKGKLYNK